MLNWEQLIAERVEWAKYNFPGIDPQDTMFGVVEELGELCHSHIKKKSRIRNNEDHDGKAMDAVGDLIIFLLSVMDRMMVVPANDYEPSLLYRRTQDSETALFYLSYWVGYMSFCEAEGRAGKIRDYHVIDNIVYYAGQYCSGNYWDFDQIVMNTWEHVKQRDWQKNSVDGS
jgi:hypothetical protein